MEGKLDRLIELWIQIAKHVAHQQGQSFEERTATILQFHTLSFLENSNGDKVSDVANYLHASLSSTTQLVERMHKARLLDRKENPKDRRVTIIAITAEGREMLQKMKATKRNRMKQLLINLDEKDVTELIRIQEKIITNQTKG